MSAIPFLDLRAEYRSIRRELDRAVARVLRRGRFILGDEVEAFEGEFAAYCGAGAAVGVGSGTDALHLALRACGLGPGDEVITVSLTAVATVAAIELSGARPLLVDVDPRRLTLDPARLESALTPRTRAIVPVHLHGCPATLDPIIDFARGHKLLLVEDCAQAHGAVYRGRRAGSWGDAAAFSFYPTKNLGAYGDGGAVLTSDPALADRVRALRQYGWTDGQISRSKGLNSRLDELQAAVLRVKLRHLDAWNARRRALAGLYDEFLPHERLTLPFAPPDGEHVYHNYAIGVDERDALRDALARRGIQTLMHYPVPVHLQPAYAGPDCAEGALPATEAAAKRTLSLPLYPGMSMASIRRVCRAVRECLREQDAAL